MALMRISFKEFKGIDQSNEKAALSMSPNAYNIDTSRGTLRRCDGYAKYIEAPLPGNVSTLMKFHKRVGGVYTDYLLAATESAVYALKEGVWTTVAQGRHGGRYSFINYQLAGEDVLFMANGADYPLKWDGETAAEVAEIPKFSDITLHYERMWGVGVPGEPDRVYYSASFNPQDFTTAEKAGFIDLPTFDGGAVIAVRAVFDDIAVFKKENLFRIFGTYPGVYEVSRVYGVVGPVAQNSIVSTGDRAFFLSRNGLCVYDGVRAAPFASGQIKDITARVNPAYAWSAVAAYHNGVYYLALPLDGSSVNNAIIELDLNRGTFMLRLGLRVTSFLEFGDRLLMADGGPNVYEFNKGNDYGGSPIDACWETPPIDMDKCDEKKSVKRMYAYASGERLRVAVRSDTGQRVKETALKPAMSKKKLILSGGGRRFSLEFSNAGGCGFELSPPEIIVETEGE